MKRLFSFLETLLPHLVLILSLMMITFFVIDRFNEAMAFLHNSLTKWLLLVFSVLALILALLFIIRRYRRSQ